MEGTEDNADSIKDGVYWAHDFGSAVRFWCFISVGLIVALVVGIYWGERNVYSKIVNGEDDDEPDSNLINVGDDHYNLHW